MPEDTEESAEGESLSEDDSLAEHDIEALRITHDEARSVLDHQIQTFNDVDNKAARTFRLDAILLGLLLTAASFVVQTEAFDITPYINLYTIAGVVLLIVSFIVAVITYTTTTIQTGLGPTDIQRLVTEKYTEKEWLILLLRSEAAWMQQNERQQTINGILLTLSHAALILAILAFSAGVAVVHIP